MKPRHLLLRREMMKGGGQGGIKRSQSLFCTIILTISLRELYPLTSLTPVFLHTQSPHRQVPSPLHTCASVALSLREKIPQISHCETIMETGFQKKEELSTVVLRLRKQGFFIEEKQRLGMQLRYTVGNKSVFIH